MSEKIMGKKKNIIIRKTFVIYNTNKVYELESNKKIVKIPSYVIDNVILNKKTILIKVGNDSNLALYTQEELRKKISTIESKKYDGYFQGEKIEYNLIQIEV